MLEIIKDTVSYIKTHIQVEPEIGIVLGTGLGGLVKEIDIHTSLSYEKYQTFLFLPLKDIVEN